MPLIFALSVGAALGGLLPGEGSSYGVVNFRGESVTINARGLCHWDTLSSAAQMQANDLVTLVVGLPLLAVGFVLGFRGSIRGRLLLAGTLGYFLYTYATMCFGAAYNAFFLVYVAIFGASLWAFVLAVASFDVDSLPARFSARLPRAWIAGLLLFAAAFLGLAWLGRIAATFKPGAVPALENVTSMFIQALDLGVILPLCVVSAVLLLRRRPWGYLLSSIALLKFLSLGLAVSLMGLNMLRVGAAVSPIELGVFPALALANFVTVVILLRSIGPAPAPAPAPSQALSSAPTPERESHA